MSLASQCPPFLHWSVAPFLVSYSFSHFYPARVPRFFLSPCTGVCVSSSRFVVVSPCIRFHIFHISSVRRFHIFFFQVVLRFSFPCSRVLLFSCFLFLLHCFVSPVFLFLFCFFLLFAFLSFLVCSVRSSSFSKWLRSFVPCVLRIALQPCEPRNRKITSTPERRTNEHEVVPPLPPPPPCPPTSPLPHIRL